MTERRHYSAEQRSEAVGLAVSVGIREAGRRLGISHRTISHWFARPEAQAAIVRSRDDVTARLWEAFTVGTDAVLDGLRDPKARLSDKAQALRIVGEQYALLTGGPTSNAHNVNVNMEAGWGSEAYADAPDEIKAASQSILSDAMTEIVAGTTALRVAGATGSSMQLDGVAVRANLTRYDVRAVEAFLARLEAAMEAGVDASDIIAGLTAKRIGDGNG